MIQVHSPTLFSLPGVFPASTGVFSGCGTPPVPGLFRVFVLMKGQSWNTEEKPLFVEACPAFGFDMVEDMELSLVPNDPVRHIILAVKKGEGNPRRAKKYLARL